jgi:hypothetical protein
MAQERVYRWRRIDGASLEVMRLLAGADSVRARGAVVVATKDPFFADYDWLLDASWRTRTLSITLRQQRSRTLTIERATGGVWRINGATEPALDECEEVDLSLTPFCNTLALHRLDLAPGGVGELVTLYVEFPALSLVPSRQRYERLAVERFRYTDLGAHHGFEAQLVVDADGLVRTYEGLFALIDADTAFPE